MVVLQHTAWHNKRIKTPIL